MELILNKDEAIAKWKVIVGVVLSSIISLGITVLPNKVNEFFASSGISDINSYLVFFLWAILLVKIIIIDNVFKISINVQFFSKILEVLISVYIFTVYDSAIISALLFLTLILSSGISNGSNFVKISTMFSVSAILVVMISKVVQIGFASSLGYLLYQILSIAICIILGRLFGDYLVGREDELKEKEKKISELMENARGLVNENAQVKCKLSDLQIRTDKANKSLAELSTLKQVSQVINSTLNIKELFDLVNDIVIGLLGVTYCTIFMKSSEPGKITVEKSNIDDKLYLETLKEKVALRIFNLAEQGQKILANNIDPFTYPNGIERGIQSAIFVPIANKGRLFGLILAEHTLAQDIESQTKFIEAVANQIGLAIENAILYNEMQKLATTDALTKVYNRMYFQKYFAEEFKKAQGNYPICAVMMDIDFFKKFNDTYGHDFGDQVLISTAQIVKQNLNTNGLIARYGGEEFIIILKNTSLDEGYRIADNLRQMIENNKVTYNGQTVTVNVSMGVAECPLVANNEKDLLKSADEALYKAKESGRNCVRKGVPVVYNA